MFSDDVIGKMKKGAILINTARGAIADTDAVARALESGQLGGCKFAAGAVTDSMAVAVALLQIRRAGPYRKPKAAYSAYELCRNPAAAA